MNVRDLEIRSYEDAEKLLKGKTIRRVCNNTLLHRNGYNISVALHGHPIVVWNPKAVYLYVCEYRTATTKDRMNRCIPKEYHVYSHKKQWMVVKSDSDIGGGMPWTQRVLFREGMNLMTAFDGVVSETE